VLTWGCAPQDGYTPLHIAAAFGYLEVARLLLEAGADITATTTVSGRSVGYGGLGFEREEVLGKADSLGGSLDDLAGLDEKAF